MPPLERVFRRPLAWGAACLVLAACSAAPPPASPPEVIVPAAAAAKEAAPLEAATTPCLNGPAGPRCDGLIDPEEAAALPGDIDAAHQAMIRSQFGDVGAIVRLSRLQIRRDKDEANQDGPSDAARGLRNAMRAVAVDDTSAAAHVALALALSRSLKDAWGSPDPALRGIALALLESRLRTAPSVAPSVRAAAMTLAGYVALEGGQGAEARALFQEATRLAPDLGTAWVGLGDAARSASDFAAAGTAYGRAAARLPRDPGVARAIAAASRGEKLALPAAPAAVPRALSLGTFAWPPPPPPLCSPAEAAKKEAAGLCQALLGLGAVRSPAEHEAAAQSLLAGWAAMRPLCEAGDKACTPVVVAALSAASASFVRAGRVAKAIAAGKMVLQFDRFPGAAAIAPRTAVEIGDRYFTLGIFDEAANWYTRGVELGRMPFSPAAERALAIHAALGNAEAAKKLAAGLAGQEIRPAASRVPFVLLAAAVVRQRQGAEAAEAWLRTFTPLLDEAGAGAAAAEIAKPLPPPAKVTCAAPLACAARRLAGEAW